jgi:hypothetical protein
MDEVTLNRHLKKEGINLFLNKAINIEYVGLILQSFNRLFEYQYKFFEIIEMIDENKLNRKMLNGEQYHCKLKIEKGKKLSIITFNQMDP